MRLIIAGTITLFIGVRKKAVMHLYNLSIKKPRTYLHQLAVVKYVRMIIKIMMISLCYNAFIGITVIV